MLLADRPPRCRCRDRSRESRRSQRRSPAIAFFPLVAGMGVERELRGERRKRRRRRGPALTQGSSRRRRGRASVRRPGRRPGRAAQDLRQRLQLRSRGSRVCPRRTQVRRKAFGVGRAHEVVDRVSDPAPGPTPSLRAAPPDRSRARDLPTPSGGEAALFTLSLMTPTDCRSGGLTGIRQNRTALAAFPRSEAVRFLRAPGNRDRSPHRSDRGCAPISCSPIGQRASAVPVNCSSAGRRHAAGGRGVAPAHALPCPALPE